MKTIVVFFAVVLMASAISVNAQYSSKTQVKAGIEAVISFPVIIYPSVGGFVNIGTRSLGPVVELSADYKYISQSNYSKSVGVFGAKWYFSAIGSNDCKIFVAYDYRTNGYANEPTNNGQRISDSHLLSLGLGTCTEGAFNGFIKVGANYNPKLKDCKFMNAP
jgi:hypothetical protein